jgi:hypothetical protein
MTNRGPPGHGKVQSLRFHVRSWATRSRPLLFAVQSIRPNPTKKNLSTTMHEPRMKHRFSRIGKLRNEPMRSKREFKVPGSRVNVSENAKRTHRQVWTKNLSTKCLKSAVKQNYQTNPTPCRRCRFLYTSCRTVWDSRNSPPNFYQTKPCARPANSRFQVQGFKVTKRTQPAFVSIGVHSWFRRENYQTKPMLEAPKIYLQNPRLNPASGFLPNEPMRLWLTGSQVFGVEQRRGPAVTDRRYRFFTKRTHALNAPVQVPSLRFKASPREHEKRTQR